MRIYYYYSTFCFQKQLYEASSLTCNVPKSPCFSGDSSGHSEAGDKVFSWNPLPPVLEDCGEKTAWSPSGPPLDGLPVVLQQAQET